MRQLACLCVIVNACVLLSGQKPPARDLQPGQLVPVVKSAANPEQTYALYLPSSYTPSQTWPIIYVFDPGARGAMPVELMKAAAERYGFIVAASNNSRNGPWDASFVAARAVWDDTHTSLSLDQRRVYFAGFSGGARVAAQLAQGCNCAHGVFLNGAGFGGVPPSPKPAFAVFALIGLGDFNYGELLNLDAQLEKLGYRHFLQRFDGGHNWAPADTWQQALSWAAILEIKDGSRAQDQAFVDAEFERATEIVRKREAGGELYFARQEYRGLASAYTGLAKSTLLKERIAALENNPGIRAQAKQEQTQIESQGRLTSQVFEATDRLRTRRDDERDLRTQAMGLVTGLRHDLEREKRPEGRRVLERALGSIFVAMMEGSVPLIEQREFRGAEFYLQLAAVARPEWAWPHMRLALCHAQMDNRKDARRDLATARQLGASPEELTTLVRTNVKLNEIVDVAEMEKILATPVDKKPN